MKTIASEEFENLLQQYANDLADGYKVGCEASYKDIVTYVDAKVSERDFKLIEETRNRDFDAMYMSDDGLCMGYVDPKEIIDEVDKL